MWRSAGPPADCISVSRGQRDLAGAAILEAGAERGRIEVAANEDDLVHALLCGSPGTAGAALKRHVDAVEDEAAVLAGDMENAFDAQEIAPARGNQRVDPAIELAIVDAGRAADGDAADIFGVLVVVLVKQMRVDGEYVFQIESAHIEHAIERKFAVLRAVNAGKRIEAADFVLDRIDPRQRLKIDLVEEDDVGEGDLLARLVMLQLKREVAGIDHRDDGVERETCAQNFVENERLDHRRRIGETARLDHHAVKREA